MFGTKLEVVYDLRSMAVAGCKPSDMLRMILSRHPGEMLDKDVFYQYFIETFCFSEGEASPLFGWLPDGTGELKDSNIDNLMNKRIQKNKGVWENAPRTPS
jgi:hypothetical protein